MADYPKAQSGEKGGEPGAPVAMQPMPSAPPGTAPVPGAQGMVPAGAGWMPAPQAPANCPPGLEYLAQVDQLLIKQKVEGLEAFTGYETNNKYEILNSLGQRVFYASKEVMHLSRGLRCNCCMCPCCLQKVTVEAPAGHTIGYVSQAWSMCKPQFKIQTANEDTVLRIKGPCCTWNLCGEIEFDWSGLAKEAFTDADNYGISFPIDLDVNVKAVLIGAVFLIDFMYFENNTKKDKDKISKAF
ncbi:PLS2-like protein [Mya arenaria]|uniref:Phospholipid scramblase n=1 Tax=Mya arenaria TaxID=6604 RepID=A0ABY7G312_MYAAR|nr:PLS2-like protein [Mya arenaria]